MASGLRPDAIIVGAGIVGAACADALSRAGLRVRVLDAGFPGGGTTAAGMGHLVVMDDSEEQFALSAYSLGLWRELEPELPADCEFDPCGTLWVAEDEAQLEAVRAKHAYYGARGVETEIVDEHGVARLEPELRAGMAGALRVPGDAVVYPPAAARFLLERAVARGADFRAGARVDRIEAGAVVVNGGRMEAGLVVNAAGAAAARLTPGLPIVPRKGHLAITDRYPGFCRHQIVELGYLRSAHEMTSESVAFNLQPRRTGQVLIGSSRELVGWDAALNRRILHRMLERAREFVPGIASLDVLRVWTGFRPATPDKLPLVGRWGEVDRLWIAAGHEGLGITTALGTAALLADLVMGRTPAIAAEPFAPGRVTAEAGAAHG